MTYPSEPFDPGRHIVDSFSCGEPTLDIWLQEQAVAADARGAARTWMWTGANGQVVAYYALSAHKVASSGVPSRLRGGISEIPSILIGRLALALELRGQGLGEVLVADALTRVVLVTRTVGVRLVVVDALHESVAHFYERLGFRRVPGSLLLVQRVADIASVFDP